MASVTRDAKCMSQKKAQGRNKSPGERVSRESKGFQEYSHLSWVLKKECSWPKASQPQVKAREIYWGKTGPFGRRPSNLEWQKLGALGMCREERLIGNDNESMFWGSIGGGLSHQVVLVCLLGK